MTKDASFTITIGGVSKAGIDWIQQVVAQTGRHEEEIARAALSVGVTHPDEVLRYLGQLDDK